MVDNLTGPEQNLAHITGAIPRCLFILAGPSGVGKNTIIKKLLTNNPRMARVRTYTTRERRKDETADEQYHFVSRDEFRALALAGKLMEADASTAGHDVYGLGALYSMPRNPFENIPEQQHLMIAEVDIYGMRRLKSLYPDSVAIFITAPPLDLLQRIRERPDDNMNRDAIAHRMQTAQEQIRAAGEFDYLIINSEDRLDETVKIVEAIIMAERSRVRPGVDLEAALPEDAFSAALE